MTIDEIITTLLTPIDFSGLHVKVASIQAELANIGAELEAMETALADSKANLDKVRTEWLGEEV